MAANAAKQAADAAKQAADIAKLQYDANTPRVTYRLSEDKKYLIVSQRSGRYIDPSFAWVSRQCNGTPVPGETFLSLKPRANDKPESLPDYVSSELTTHMEKPPCSSSSHIRLSIHGVSEIEEGSRYGEKKIYDWK